MKYEILLVSDHLGLQAWAWRTFQSWRPRPGDRDQQEPQGTISGRVLESCGETLGAQRCREGVCEPGCPQIWGARGLAGSGSLRSVSAQGPSWAPRHHPTQPAPSDNSQGSSEYWLMLVKHLKIKYAVCEQAFCFSCIGDRGDKRGISILREKCWA